MGRSGQDGTGNLVLPYGTSGGILWERGYIQSDRVTELETHLLNAQSSQQDHAAAERMESASWNVAEDALRNGQRDAERAGCS